MLADRNGLRRICGLDCDGFRLIDAWQTGLINTCLTKQIGNRAALGPFERVAFLTRSVCLGIGAGFLT